MFGIFLIIIGGVYLLKNTGYLTQGAWDLVWPLALVSFGLYLVAKKHKHGGLCEWCGCGWKKGE